HSGKEVLRLSVANRTHSQPPSMRARTDAGVIAITPVSEIVPAFVTRPGVITDLVSRHSCRRGHDIGHLVERSGCFGVERFKIVPRDHACKARARLERQLVERAV